MLVAVVSKDTAVKIFGMLGPRYLPPMSASEEHAESIE
jgi:hypothetical protein